MENSKKLIATVLLLLIVVTGFYACKKNNTDLLNANSSYQGELKTYHESKDYKNLLLQFPNQTFTDMPIIQVNSKMKAIVTNIVSSSGLIVKSITYFEPEKNRTNTWYPTIVTKTTSEILPIKEMQEKKNFTGNMEILSSNGNLLSRTIVKNNLIVDYDSGFDLHIIEKTVSNSVNGKLMNTGGSLSDCMSAAISCWHGEVNNMGIIGYAGYVATFPTSAYLILADCMLHDKACLGLNKPVEVMSL